MPLTLYPDAMPQAGPQPLRKQPAGQAAAPALTIHDHANWGSMGSQLRSEDCCFQKVSNGPAPHPFRPCVPPRSGGGEARQRHAVVDLALDGGRNHFATCTTVCFGDIIVVLRLRLGLGLHAAPSTGPVTPSATFHSRALGHSPHCCRAFLLSFFLFGAM